MFIYILLRLWEHFDQKLKGLQNAAILFVNLSKASDLLTSRNVYWDMMAINSNRSGNTFSDDDAMGSFRTNAA